MQIVIEISENEYQNVMRGRWEGNPLAEYIENGIPLQKGHGRLIDVDDLDITTITTDDYSGNEVLDIVLKEDVDDAPTIIEADVPDICVGKKAGEDE